MGWVSFWAISSQTHLVTLHGGKNIDDKSKTKNRI
jgi:hypothetical protein